VTSPTAKAERIRDRYDAFLSYKHGSGSGFALLLQRSIQRHAKVFISRSRRVFRDEDYISAGSDLPETILTALDRSGFLILLASPEAARSQWVQSELKSWCEELGRARQLIIIVTDGTLSVDAARRTIDWDTTSALPRSLERHLDYLPCMST